MICACLHWSLLFPWVCQLYLQEEDKEYMDGRNEMELSRYLCKPLINLESRQQIEALEFMDFEQ